MEITLDLAQAYMLDRVEELINYDVKAGTPFVFLSTLTLLNTMVNWVGKLEDEEVTINHLLGDKYKDLDLETAHKNMVWFYSLKGSKINLSHENKKHLKTKKGKTTISAEPFLYDVKFAIVKFFEGCKDCKVMAAKVYVSVNENKFIGYGD